MDYISVLDKLRSLGYLVERKSPHHHRIECVLDLYSRYRWHNLATDNRGTWHDLSSEKRFESLCRFIDKQVMIADAILDREIAAGHVQEEEKQHGPWLNESNKPWFTKVQR